MNPASASLLQTWGFWNGRLDEIAIFNRALTAAQVRQLSVGSWLAGRSLVTITPMSIYDCSSQLPGREADRTMDGSGLDGTGQHTDYPNGTMWETDAATTGTPNAPLPAYITFDLGANYDLASTHVWNYNEMFANYAGYYYARGCKDVTISVASTATNPKFRSLGSFVFAEATHLDTYAGETYNLSGASNVRLVRFEITSVYPDVHFPQAAGLSEVRFEGTPVPAPTSGPVAPNVAGTPGSEPTTP